MQAYEPYQIHHVDPDKEKTLTVPGSNSFVVIWSDNKPLAHLWMDKRNLPDSETGYRRRIEEAAQPAKTYYRNHPLSADHNATGQKLSVILCTGNGERNLEKCIHALLNNSDTDFELIVIDHMPENSRAKDLVQKLKHIKYVKELRKGPGIARNTGARVASHALIAYTTDDITVGRDWVRNIKTAFSGPEVMAITGIVFPESLEASSQYTFEKYWGSHKGYIPQTLNPDFIHKHTEEGLPAGEICASGNMAFRKEVFDWAGGFDERLDKDISGSCGASEIFYRIQANGWTCLYIPSLYVFHAHPGSPAAFSRQLTFYTQGQTCSLLVQYENFHRKADLNQLYKIIPGYYFRRLRNLFIKKEEHRGSLYAEIKGHVSGWFHYYSRKKRPGYELPFFIPYPLHKQVSVHQHEPVSVIISGLNASARLQEAVESALSQTHSPAEVIIVYDDSTINIESTRYRFGEQVQYVRTSHSGVSIAKNRGIAHSHGSFLVLLDADNYLYPDALAQQLDWFRKYPDAVFISGAHDVLEPEGNILPAEIKPERKADNYGSLLQENYTTLEAAVMYRRSVFPAFHFDPLLSLCGGYDLNLRIARYFEVHAHAGKVAAYRTHRTNKSIDRKNMLQADLSVLQRQKGFLYTDSEVAAWKEGIRNRRRYYRIHRNGNDLI